MKLKRISEVIGLWNREIEFNFTELVKVKTCINDSPVFKHIADVGSNNNVDWKNSKAETS